VIGPLFFSGEISDGLASISHSIPGDHMEHFWRNVSTEFQFDLGAGLKTLAVVQDEARVCE
jgi:hypothetical protein